MVRDNRVSGVFVFTLRDRRVDANSAAGLKNARAQVASKSPRRPTIRSTARNAVVFQSFRALLKRYVSYGSIGTFRPTVFYFNSDNSRASVFSDGSCTTRIVDVRGKCVLFHLDGLFSGHTRTVALKTLVFEFVNKNLSCLSVRKKVNRFFDELYFLRMTWRNNYLERYFAKITDRNHDKKQGLRCDVLGFAR